ncbi:MULTISPECIES: glycosyltransferase family 2 protein [Leptolyngbya]|uniref:glycosyltransferase family 2 protein n=1 Tax=Leptolyngbya TaxID=47251 RepID=UPI00168802F8|nr:glycosyltransferase family 2 protein [Leptolyngbya sp. FACHB-1624]MBD1854094.1 glycosyltransferase family 2 protein [Leptolyngbya sp. FACHB-1624]
MKTSVLINNYNYQTYVIDAIESVLNQSAQVDEIIIVDDCSTDQSAQVLQDFLNSKSPILGDLGGTIPSNRSPNINLILKKKNEGQLAAFQDGFNAATGELIFFLDADDLYQETYIEIVLNFYQNHPACDFLFTSSELFGNEERIATCYTHTRDLGYSKISTLYRRTWIGHRTSTLSMRRHVLEAIFPIPYLEDWRIRADDCVTYGTSIANAHKFYLNQPLVKYRVHGNNGYYGRLKTRSPEYFQQYEQAIERLFKFWIKKFNYSEDIDQFAGEEFRSIPHPTQQEFDTFQSIIRCTNLPKIRKGFMLVLAYLYFLRHRNPSECSPQRN